MEDGVTFFAKPSAKRKKPATQQPHVTAADEPPKSEAEARSQGEASTTDPELSSFKSLGLTDWLCSVCRSLGMVRPTMVQQACIPAVLKGRDVIGLASTGSGKTAAFGECPCKGSSTMFPGKYTQHATADLPVPSLFQHFLS